MFAAEARMIARDLAIWLHRAIDFRQNAGVPGHIGDAVALQRRPVITVVVLNDPDLVAVAGVDDVGTVSAREGCGGEERAEYRRQDAHGSSVDMDEGPGERLEKSSAMVVEERPL